MILYRAECVSAQNFRFEGFGTSPVLAKRALRAGLERHAVEFTRSPDWANQIMADCVTIKMVAGQAMRDREVL